MQMVKENPCKNVTLPKPDTKEREIYTLEEAQRLLELFEQEDECYFKYVVFFTLAMYTGLRKGELLGLEWKDFDFEHNLMTVVRTSMWAKGKGMYTDTPKTKTSQRVLKIPDNIVELLKRYKTWQDKCQKMFSSSSVPIFLAFASSRKESTSSLNRSIFPFDCAA